LQCAVTQPTVTISMLTSHGANALLVAPLTSGARLLVPAADAEYACHVRSHQAGLRAFVQNGLRSFRGTQRLDSWSRHPARASRQSHLSAPPFGSAAVEARCGRCSARCRRRWCRCAAGQVVPTDCPARGRALGCQRRCAAQVPGCIGWGAKVIILGLCCNGPSFPWLRMSSPLDSKAC